MATNNTSWSTWANKAVSMTTSLIRISDGTQDMTIGPALLPRDGQLSLASNCASVNSINLAC